MKDVNKNLKMEAFLALIVRCRKFDKANIGLIDIGNTHPIILRTLVFITKRGKHFFIALSFLKNILSVSFSVGILQIINFIFF